MLIVGDFHLRLTLLQCGFDLSVDLCQVLEILDGGGNSGGVGSWVQAAVRMTTGGSEEWSLIVRGVDRVVVRELCGLDVLQSIRLMVVHV